MTSSMLGMCSTSRVNAGSSVRPAFRQSVHVSRRDLRVHIAAPEREITHLGAIGDQSLAADGPGKCYGPNGKIQKVRALLGCDCMIKSRIYITLGMRNGEQNKQSFCSSCKECVQQSRCTRGACLDVLADILFSFDGHVLFWIEINLEMK